MNYKSTNFLPLHSENSLKSWGRISYIKSIFFSLIFIFIVPREATRFRDYLNREREG